jgi:hypothetical protein
MIIFVDENAKRWGAQVGGIYISRGRFFNSERAQFNSPAQRDGERKDELPALQGRDNYFAPSGLEWMAYCDPARCAGLLDFAPAGLRSAFDQRVSKQ